jgi:hypothetical protein
MNRFANLVLEQLDVEIYALCKDQHGCRYLQKKLEDRSPDQVHCPSSTMQSSSFEGAVPVKQGQTSRAQQNSQNRPNAQNAQNQSNQQERQVPADRNRGKGRRANRTTQLVKAFDSHLTILFQSNHRLRARLSNCPP